MEIETYNTHIPEEILLQTFQQNTGSQQPEFHHQHEDQGWPQDGHVVVEGDGQEGERGQQYLDGDDRSVQHILRPKQLVWRKYRLKVGVKQIYK